MENISIFTDSCSDIKNKDIKVLPLYYYFDEIEYGDKNNISMREFFSKMKKGGIPRTAAVNTENAKQKFEFELQKGNNIICVCMSSGLSSTYNNVLLAANELKEKYPEAKISVIDSLTGSLAEGIIALKALKMKNENFSYEDIVNYLETYKKYYNIEFFVKDLSHLQRGGRISKGVELVGNLLNIKPLLYANENGKISVAEKVMGLKRLDSVLIERLSARLDRNSDIVGIVHSNTVEDANRLRDKIVKLTDIAVMIKQIGPIIASHIGEGSFGLIYKMNSMVR